MRENARFVPAIVEDPILPRFEKEAIRIRSALAARIASVPIWTPAPDLVRAPRWSETTQTVLKKVSERIACISEQE